jgi:two-component system response regulator AlgR
MKLLVIDSASPEHARLHRLLHGGDRNRPCLVDSAAELQAMLARRRPGDLVLLQAGSARHPGPQTDARCQICACVRGGLQQVPVAEVRYFLAEHKYVWVRTAQGRVLIRESLQALAQEFAAGFVRIHRNALVATRYLAGLSGPVRGGCRVRLEGIEERLPVSRRRVAALRRLIRRGQGDPNISSLAVIAGAATQSPDS